MGTKQHTNYTVKSLSVSRGLAIGGPWQENIFGSYNNWVNPGLIASSNVTAGDLTKNLIHRTGRSATLYLNMTFNVPAGTPVVTFTGLPYAADTSISTTYGNPVKLNNTTGPVDTVAYAEIIGDTLQITYPTGFITPIATAYTVVGQVCYSLVF